MAQPRDRVVEIALDEGVQSFPSGWAIGPRLRSAANLIAAPWGRTDLAARTLGYPAMPAGGGTILTGTESIAGVGVFTDSGGTRLTVLFAKKTTSTWSLYASNGVEITGGTAMANAAQTVQACFAYRPDTPALYVSHQSATTIWKVTAFGAAGKADYTGTNVPAGAYALAWHLDRLWMAHPSTVGRTLVFYTDPFDDTTVRATSYLDIPDEVNALGKTIIGTVDATGQAHLVIGGRASIWVLDGDPTLGNALLRQLAVGIGIRRAGNLCETPYGLLCYTTDRQLNLIEPGALRLVPVGEPIRDMLQACGTNEMLPTMVWVAPYVYCWFGTATSAIATLENGWILDLTSGRARWWGPQDTGGVVTAGLTHTVSGAAGASAGLTSTTIGMNDVGRSTAFALDTANDSPRRQALSTGYVFEPGHKVELHRVVLYHTMRTNVFTNRPNILVTATRADGTTVARETPLTGTTTTAAEGIVSETTWVPTVPVVSSFFTIDVAAGPTSTGSGAGLSLGLQRMELHYRVQPLVQ